MCKWANTMISFVMCKGLRWCAEKPENLLCNTVICHYKRNSYFLHERLHWGEELFLRYHCHNSVFTLLALSGTSSATKSASAAVGLLQCPDSCLHPLEKVLGFFVDDLTLILFILLPAKMSKCLQLKSSQTNFTWWQARKKTFRMGLVLQCTLLKSVTAYEGKQVAKWKRHTHITDFFPQCSKGESSLIPGHRSPLTSSWKR